MNCKQILLQILDRLFSPNLEWNILGIDFKITGKPAVILNITKSLSAINIFIFCLRQKTSAMIVLLAIFLYLGSWFCIKEASSQNIQTISSTQATTSSQEKRITKSLKINGKIFTKKFMQAC